MIQLPYRIFNRADGTAISIQIEAYRNVAESPEGEMPLHPQQLDYEEHAAQFGFAVEKVRERLVELDETEPDD
jgi:hypothetical protein